MNGTVLFYLVAGVAMWLLGLHGLLVVRHLLRRILAINVMTGGVFLVLVALGAREGGMDPVMQALVLTGLVVSVSATAFALHLGTAVIGRERGADRE